MKKKVIAMMVVAVLITAQPISVLGAPSISIGGGSSSSGSDSSSSSTTVLSEEAKAVQDAQTGIGSSGVRLEGANMGRVQTSTDTGLPVSLGFVAGNAAVAGLPQPVLDSINMINSGTMPLNEAVKDVDLTGYNALVKTSALIARDPVTEAEVKGNVKLTLYIPNLAEGIGTIQVLFYDNNTGKWTLINPAGIDYTTKQIIVEFTGSGTFSVVYKK